MSDRTEAWLIVLVALVVVAIGAYQCATQLDCTARGGFLVRGPFGYTCVKASGVEVLR